MCLEILWKGWSKSNQKEKERGGGFLLGKGLRKTGLKLLKATSTQVQ
jgi:hypothetical protein